MPAAPRNILPGFRLSIGVTVFYMTLLVVLPIGACAAGVFNHLAAIHCRRLFHSGAVGVWTHVWGGADRRVNQRPARASRGVGAGALRFSVQTIFRRHRGSALCFADGGGRSRLRQSLCRAGLARPMAGAAGIPWRLFAGSRRAGAGLHRFAVCGAHSATGPGKLRCGCRRGGHIARSHARADVLAGAVAAIGAGIVYRVHSRVRACLGRIRIGDFHHRRRDAVSYRNRGTKLIVEQLEQFHYTEATAIAVVLLAASFLMLIPINLLERWSKRFYG